MKWNIVCDSSCDILTLPDLARDTAFSVAPLKIIVGDREFVDDETLDRQRLLDAMASFKGASSSACPALFEWARQFEKADFSIAICISSQLSGAYNSAMVAKDMVLEKLYKLDKVAYIRFASVYKHFENLQEFISEVNRIDCL